MSIFSSIAARFSPVYGVASAYYKTRLAALREPDMQKRNNALAALNQVQPTLDTLESTNISYFEKHKMINTVKDGVVKAKSILKAKPAPKPAGTPRPALAPAPNQPRPYPQQLR